MITLFEYFNASAKELYNSLNIASPNLPTFVLEDDGFLPDDVMTPYKLFSRYQPGTSSRPMYFNGVPIPTYWEIEGTNENASIIDNGKVRAYIIYKKNYLSRIVQQVQWLDEKGIIRTIDHYTKHGTKFARTVNDEQGQTIFKTYLNQQGEIVIYENYVTKSIMLYLDNKEYMFDNKTEFASYFLSRLDIDTSQVIFNSLATPLFAIINRNIETRAFLFWQEKVQQQLPGNMSFILEMKGKINFKVVVPDEAEYHKILALVGEESKHKIVKSGYVYQYHRKNRFSKNVLTVTNSDQLPHIEEIIQRSPQYTFNITAVTEMSSTLMRLGKYDNVKLYPSVELNVARKLYENSDIYLDINLGNEILNAVRSAYDYDLLIMGYRETAHNPAYTAQHLLFAENDAASLIEHLHKNRKAKEAALTQQKVTANAVTVEEFRKTIGLKK